MIAATVLKELEETFERRTNRDNARKWVLNTTNPGRKDIQNVALEEDCSRTWIKACSGFKFSRLTHFFTDEYVQDATDFAGSSSAHSALKQSCHLISLASSVHAKLLDYAMERNSGGMKLIFKPQTLILTEEMMTAWVTFVERYITHVFSLETVDADDNLRLVVDTIKSFQEGKWFHLGLPVGVLTRLISIAGLPWLEEFKEFLPKNNPSQLPVAGLETIQPITKSRCLSTLCSPMFIPWQDFVLRIVASQLNTTTNNNSEDLRPLVNVILDLIQEENWVIRSLPWSQIILFLKRIQTQFDWKSEELRQKLTSALVKLPCLYSHHGRLSALNGQKRTKKTAPKLRKLSMQLLRNPCPSCYCSEKFNPRNLLDNNDNTTSEEDLLLIPLPEQSLRYILLLAVPLLRSGFQCVKIKLAELITSVRNHSSEYNLQFIAEFTTAAVHADSVVGCEIMRNFSFFFKESSPNNCSEYQSLSQTGENDRSIGLDMMFDTLLYFLQQSLENQSSVSFSSKILLILRNLVENADRVVTVYILRFTMRLLMHRDSDVKNVLGQSLCIELAINSSSQAHHTAWELMTSLRHDLAKNIVTLILDEFCIFTDHFTQQVQAERMKGFLQSISIMGDFRTDAVFLHHYVPVLLGEIVPFLADDTRYVFLLQCLAEFASGTPEQLLQEGFHTYFRVLVLNYPPERTNNIFTFLKQSYRIDPNFLAMNAAQSTVNELLCFLSDRKDKVLKFIPCLPQRRSDAFNLHIGPVSATRSQLQEILNNHLMGFFLFVDTKLHSRIECVRRRRRILQSFTILLEFMGKSRITANRAKVYATLNSLFSLGPDFSDLLLESWKVFATSLENVPFTQMSVQILAAVATLHPYLPSKVESLVSYFVHTKKDLCSELYPELYFVSDLTTDPNVLVPIKEAIDGNGTDSWLKFFETLVNESCKENSHIRLLAITKLQGILSQDYNNVKNFILDTEHPVVSQLLSSFLNTARDADRAMLMRLAESFGSLGAIDPYRFKNSRDEETRRKSKPVLTVVGPCFAAKYLDLLVREFQDATDYDYCACLIQQLLQHFQVKKDDEDPVWKTLSPSARERVEPLLTSKYKVDKIHIQLHMSSPIYLSDHGKNFDSWLSNWSSAMSGAVAVGTPPYDLFQFSKYLVQRNNRVASFLLPYVATYAIIGGKRKEKREIVTEIETILKKWIEQDTMKNSQILTAIKESQASDGTPEPEPKILYDEDVIQYRCTQEVFSVLDHLFRAVRSAKRQACLVRATEVQNQARRAAGNPLKVLALDTANPCLAEEDADVIARILEQIPLSTVSQVAFHCEDYKRALFYAEQDLKKNPHKLQERLNDFQKLHFSLNDMDSVIGIAKIRSREGTMSEGVCESFAKGKIEEGVRSLELVLNDDPQDLIAASALLQAYLSMDEPRKTETLIKGCVSRNPHWEVALQDFQIEATWKLRDWTQLREQISSAVLINSTGSSSSSSNVISISANNPIHNSNSQFHQLTLPSSSANEASQQSWSMTIVQILSHIRNLEIELAQNLVNEARLKLMNPLVAAAKDYNAYSRSYANVVQLHILTEVEQALGLFERSGRPSFKLEMELKSLISQWSDRGDLLLKAQTFIDPVLNVRKSILEILKDFSNGECQDLYSGSIRDCWLTAAKVERKAGNFTRAFNCITEAKKYNSAQVMIELAKLHARKGDKDAALQVLQHSIPIHFPLVEEWKKSSPTSGSKALSPLEAALSAAAANNLESSNNLDQVEVRKLCSASLLLQAQLSDQQQLLDIDKNIQNYTQACIVFQNSEKNYFTLAGYFDKLLTSSAEEKSVIGHSVSGMQEKVVQFYAKSLHYGCKYVYQSLPRLLTIWFDYAAIGYDEPGRVSSGGGGVATGKRGGGGHGSGEVRSATWERTVINMQATIKTLLNEAPAYVLLTAFSQLISRLCHPNPSTWELLKEFIGTIMSTHIHQALWNTMVVANSSVAARKDRCKQIYNFVEKKKPLLKKLMNDYRSVVDRFLDFCVKEVPPSINYSTVTTLCPRLQRYIQGAGCSDILVPFKIFLNPSIPPSGCGHKSYDAFPQKFVFMRSIEERIEVMQSVARPKRITIRGSDGKRYGLLCKPNDDLRRDFKVMEVNNVVNWYLHRNQESRQKQLHVRSYAVIPLNEQHGLLEWVPNLTGFRGCVLNLYRDKGNAIDMGPLKKAISLKDPLEMIRHKFLTQFLAPYPPVFSDWFLNNFNDPQSWYKARLSYVRTAAVMSIVGFIFGLGDRHGENILLDCSNGEIIHVDFNCIFNQGETFQTPERVPFRLTQNMVEAMGPLGVEGVFRRSCEITMNLFRQHKDIFLSVLRPFVFDPMVEWKDGSGSSKSFTSVDSRSSPSLALLHFKNIKNRINGSARNCSKEVNTELSIEAQVAYLIDEATHLDNLSRMFIGWTSFL